MNDAGHQGRRQRHNVGKGVGSSPVKALPRPVVAGMLGLALCFCHCATVPSALVPHFRGSVGTPNRGVLTNGKALPAKGVGYRRLRKDRRNYGTPQLLRAITAGAKAAARPGAKAPLLVADLSKQSGGYLRGHGSHRSGRDADLLFYFTTPGGVPIPSPGFVEVRPDGLAELPAPQRGFARFDVPRTWQLVRGMLTAKDVELEWLFVARWVEALIIQYARSVESDQLLLWRAENILHQPGDSLPHDDHFHMRVRCTAEQALHGCRHNGPNWPWFSSWPKLAKKYESDEQLVLLLGPGTAPE